MPVEPFATDLLCAVWQRGKLAGLQTTLLLQRHAMPLVCHLLADCGMRCC
jgi:hypothetical protein